MAQFKFTIGGTIKPYLAKAEHRTAPSHRMYINRHIVARIIHAAITYNFIVEARRRPKIWDKLTPISQKMKEKGNYKRTGSRQPEDLGRYPVPWGNINVRTGALFNSLGTILRITENSVVYGTDVPYASQVQHGSTVSKIHVEYMRSRTTKGGKEVSRKVSYTKDFGDDDAVNVPARPYDYMSSKENRAIGKSVQEYFMAPLGRKTILIPEIMPKIKAPGGRRVYIMRMRGG